MLERLLLSVGAGRHWRLVKIPSYVSQCREQLSVLTSISYWRKKCHFFLKKHHAGVILQLSVLGCVWSLHHFAVVDALGSLPHPHHQQGQGAQFEDDVVVGLSLSKERGGCEDLGSQIYTGIKRTKSFMLGPFVSCPAHIAINPTMLMWHNFIFPDFFPPFSSLENTGCKGIRALVVL